MGYYFDDHLSMHAAVGGGPGAGAPETILKRVLEIIAQRYVGANPPEPMTYRAFNKGGILRGKDYRYHADFAKIFPDARPEQRVYAWSKYWADAPVELKADVSCLGPMSVHLNGAEVFKSNIFTERYPDARHRISLSMQQGWNHLVMRFKKTRAGFGGAFGTWLGKHPYYFLMPTGQRNGQEGWLYTEPMDGDLETLPGAQQENDSYEHLFHLPVNAWDEGNQKKGVFERIFGLQPGRAAVAWVQSNFEPAPHGKYVLRGLHEGDVEIAIGDSVVFLGKGKGQIQARAVIPAGQLDLFVKSTCPRRGSWGFTLAIESAAGAPVHFQSPCNIQGWADPWMFTGPLAAPVNLSSPQTLARFRDLNQVQRSGGRGAHKETYWRLDGPAMWARAYNENPLFGRWNYPLGVTLYGLLHAAREIGSHDIQEYITAHMQFCCSTFRLAIWDKDHYGGATAFHTLLSSIDSLDDCGSFGSAMLEAARYLTFDGYREIADYVADYISHKQARLPDGTFYRKVLMHMFHENTMWADDLYMSVPFLCRYAALTGNHKYLDDAARQFIGFRKRLFIPELKLMSHVYDFRRHMATGVPWGRGNGWTIFSLSELLAVLPERHRRRKELLAFFRELCEGFLVLQDESGMWHQVLTDPDSYPETSCTAMFAYAFARGVRFGWFDSPSPYAHAAERAWDALTRISIDRGGSIHGVCRGSEFSFSPEYYKKELLPNLNDTHGIGIVMLAGVEVLRMMEHLRPHGGASAKDRAAPRRASRKRR